MSAKTFRELVQIWHKNRPPKDPYVVQIVAQVTLPGSDLDALPERVYFLYEWNTYALELGLYDDSDSFCPLELYVDKLTLWVLRKQIRRILAVRCVVGLYLETAKQNPALQLFATTPVPLSAITLPKPLPHKKENTGPQ